MLAKTNFFCRENLLPVDLTQKVIARMEKMSSRRSKYLELVKDMFNPDINKRLKAKDLSKKYGCTKGYIYSIRSNMRKEVLKELLIYPLPFLENFYTTTALRLSVVPFPTLVEKLAGVEQFAKELLKKAPLDFLLQQEPVVANRDNILKHWTVTDERNIAESLFIERPNYEFLAHKYNLPPGSLKSFREDIALETALYTFWRPFDSLVGSGDFRGLKIDMVSCPSIVERDKVIEESIKLVAEAVYGTLQNDADDAE